MLMLSPMLMLMLSMKLLLMLSPMLMLLKLRPTTHKHDVSRMLQSSVMFIHHNGGRFGFLKTSWLTIQGVICKISKILMNAFHGSWATWEEVDEAYRNELWAHFKMGSAYGAIEA